MIDPNERDAGATTSGESDGGGVLGELYALSILLCAL